MGRKRYTDKSYLLAIHLFKKERCRLIADSMRQSNELYVYLYKALYESKSDSLRGIEFEYYEFLGLRHHWNEYICLIKQLPEFEYYDAIKLFTSYYRNYLSKFNSSIVDSCFLDTYLSSIEELLDFNSRIAMNEKRMQAEFDKNEKIYKDLLKSVQIENAV